MDAARRLELESSLRSRLQAQVKIVRLAWLGEQVENYVERWAAFCELTQAPVADRTRGDLFGVVEIGAALFSEELARMPATFAPVHHAWQRFLDTLARIRVHDESVTSGELRRDFAGAMTSLAAQARPTRESTGGDPS